MTCPEFIRALERGEEVAEGASEECVTVVVKVESVVGVTRLVLLIVRVNAKILEEVENGYAELFPSLLDYSYVFCERLCIGLLHRSRGDLLVGRSLEVAVRGGHKDKRGAGIERLQERHQVINRAAEGLGGAILHLAKVGVAVDIVVDTAVNHDKVCTGVHIIGSSAEAEVVACLLAGLLLMGESCSADSVVVDSLEVILLFQAVVIAIFCDVGNACAFGDAVSEKVYGKSFEFHFTLPFLFSQIIGFIPK